MHSGVMGTDMNMLLGAYHVYELLEVSLGPTGVDLTVKQEDTINTVLRFTIISNVAMCHLYKGGHQAERDNGERICLRSSLKANWVY